MLLNIALAVCLLGFMGMGLKEGFVHSLGNLVGAVLGFIAARAWSMALASVFAAFMPLGISRLLAFILIFVAVVCLVGYVFKLVDGIFRVISILPFLKPLNNFLGAIFGLVEGIILVGGLIYVIRTFNMIPKLTTTLSASFVALWIQKGFESLLGAFL